MICSISGETPQEPVVSVKSGHIYEKRIILKALETNKGIDPVTHQAIEIEDLIPVKTNPIVRPRPTTATSIPGLLQLFQNEWDAITLETYTLKQQLESTRQELAHALYQHDAACRVIARLLKERDEARNTLSNVKGVSAASASEGVDSMDVESAPSSKEDALEQAKQAMVAKSTELSAGRKHRSIPATLSTADQIKSYSVLTTTNLHSPSTPGITALSIHPTKPELALTGGEDASVILFDRSSKKMIKNFKDQHSEKINDVLLHPTQDLFFSASADKTAKVWRYSSSTSTKEKDSSQNVVATVSLHTAEVTAVTLQATGDYWATTSLDGTWALHDVASGSNITRATLENKAGFSCAEFHPDGLILGTGSTDATVRVWDMKAHSKPAFNFQGHQGNVTGLSFSENGYYLATSSADNTVLLWDLRKLKSFHTINLSEDFHPTSVKFDRSGSYLAVTGSEIRVYVGKTANHIATFNNPSSKSSSSGLPFTDIEWLEDAKSFVTVSMDKSIKTWGHK